jgi:hypothetical protein
MIKSHFIALSLLAASCFAFADARGEEIAKAYVDMKAPTDTSATMVMTITDRGGVVKARKMKMVTKETSQGTKSFIEFIEPADVKGTKFLTVSKQGIDADQRLYLPAMKKVRKISSSSKDSEFVGSDFYFFDMQKHYLNEAEYSFISDGETLPGDAFAGRKFSKLSVVFKDKAAPYSKCVVWVDIADNVMRKTECYDKKDGALLKTIVVDEVKAIKGYLVPVSTTVSNVKKGSSTQLLMRDLLVDAGIKDSEVGVERLER